jgi:hypothetical protein
MCYYVLYYSIYNCLTRNIFFCIQFIKLNCSSFLFVVGFYKFRSRVVIAVLSSPRDA